MKLIITFSEKTATIEKYDEESLIYRRTMHAVKALIWMSRQGLPWIWVSDTQAIYVEGA